MDKKIMKKRKLWIHPPRMEIPQIIGLRWKCLEPATSSLRSQSTNYKENCRTLPSRGHQQDQEKGNGRVGRLVQGQTRHGGMGALPPGILISSFQPISDEKVNFDRVSFF